MASLFFYVFFACKAHSSLLNPIVQPPVNNIGTIKAREYILIAYLAQYDHNPDISMEAFSNARSADPNSATILLLWGDSAWEQGLHEKARWAWKEYQRTLSPDDRTEIEQIKQRLERS